MMRKEAPLSGGGEALRFYPPDGLRKRSHIRSLEQYHEMYRHSIENPEGFWAVYAEELDWIKKWDRIYEGDFKMGKNRWFVGGRLNASWNCLDRHLHPGERDRTAILWEGEAGESERYTYGRLHEAVCRFAGALRCLGVKKGDRVAIHLPMIPELPIAMLACARVGAVHNAIYIGYSAESLRERILDCGASLLVTCREARFAGEVIPILKKVDEALRDLPEVTRVMVRSLREDPGPGKAEGRDFFWDELTGRETPSALSDPEIMDSEDPLFILYTSGSTGKPKGVYHTTAGYLLHVKKSFEWVFDYHPEDLYWCTEDLSWIIGHSYGLYGPLLAGASLVMMEGSPHHPKPDRMWGIIEKNRVNLFYTTPAVLRVSMREPVEWIQRHDLSSLKILGSVGEPIGPEIWMWYHTHVGMERCPVMDTWWQTETGGILITPLPGAFPLKPGSAALPFFGSGPAVLREDGTECEANEGGYLVLKRPWPGMMRGVYNAPGRFRETYLIQLPGTYFTGDRARKDEEGYYWFEGRVDDVIHSFGFRIGTLEIENALISHRAVSEAAVVSFPHALKGQGIYAFVTLRPGFEKTEELKKALLEHVEKRIGGIAVPDKIRMVDQISKTLSGKIMRRILRKIAAGDTQNLGDTSSLANPSVVDELVRGGRVS